MRSACSTSSASGNIHGGRWWTLRGRQSRRSPPAQTTEISAKQEKTRSPLTDSNRRPPPYHAEPSSFRPLRHLPATGFCARSISSRPAERREGTRDRRSRAFRRVRKYTRQRVPSGREESAPSRLGERFELRVAAELEQDRADVIANCDLGDAEPGRDHLRWRALRDQLEHFVLPRGQVRLRRRLR